MIAQPLALFALLRIVVLLSATAISPAAVASPERWRAEGWTRTDFTKATIDFEEIFSGGPPKDGIPAIDRPKFVEITKVKDLGLTEPVIGLSLNGKAKAYPLRVLIWHEIANDLLGGVPVAVTYCPLCNSAVVFDRRFEGLILDFGTTGKLRKSDLVMYDRQTESWWQQFTGEGIVGTHAGKFLKTFPARLEAFERFKARHPNGRVLVPNDPRARPYGRNPYVNYDVSSIPFLFSGQLPEYINPMARVVVVKAGGKPVAVALSRLRKFGELKQGDVTISWDAGQNSALEHEVIAKGRDVGNIVARRDTPDGEKDVRYDVTFAFVFHAFHPEVSILQ